MMKKLLIIIGAAGAVTSGFLIAGASTNIVALPTSDHWAWDDVVSWIDFYNTNSINVNSFNLTGYASSSIGDISLDCATTRSGNICPVSNYKVFNDGLGNLTGFGWNDAYGWISFCGGGGSSDCPDNPGRVVYQVQIDPNSGIFAGGAINYAWNDIMGWISFNCANSGLGCGASNYRVVTAWRATSTIATLDSSIIDTGFPAGVQFNSILWHGPQPPGTSVGFQLAVSNCQNGASNPPSCNTGTWNFIGNDGTTNTTYSKSADTTIRLDYSYFNNYRYFKYRVFLVSDLSQRLTPAITEISVNWSP